MDGKKEEEKKTCLLSCVLEDGVYQCILCFLKLTTSYFMLRQRERERDLYCKNEREREKRLNVCVQAKVFCLLK